MYWSRSLEELHPRAAKKARALIERCAEELDVVLVVTCTYRDLECEKAIHEIGRSKPGRRLAFRWPTASFHPYRVAFDVLPLWNGMPIHHCHYIQEKRLWEAIGRIGIELGLEWDGRSDRRVRELGHFQFTEGLTLDDFRAGRMIR